MSKQALQAKLTIMAVQISVRALDTLTGKRADAAILRPDPRVAISCPTLVLR